MNNTNLLKYYLKKEYPMVLIPEEKGNGYVGAFPDLPGCLTTGETIDECIKMGLDAKKVWLDSMIRQGNHINEPNTIDPETLSKYFPDKCKKHGDAGYIVKTILS